MEVLGVTQSLKQARRLLDEIATRGGFTPKQYGDYAVIYQKDNDGQIDELTLVRKDARQWQIVLEKGGR